jgi:hypothetical protein
MAKQEFIVLCGQIVGGGDIPFRTEYYTDQTKFADREKAIKHGLKVRGSDDFNIGVLDDGKLVSLDWMEKPVDTDPDLLSSIQESAFF